MWDLFMCHSEVFLLINKYNKYNAYNKLNYFVSLDLELSLTPLYGVSFDPIILPV